MPNRTPFLETEILLLWLDEDREAIEDMLREMNKRERHLYLNKLASLRRFISDYDGMLYREEQEEEARRLIKLQDEQNRLRLQELQDKLPTIRGGYNEIEL